MRHALLAARILLGVVYLYAAWTKLSQPWLLFAMSIDAYGVLPEWAVLALARVLPWFELALGLVLLSGFRLRETAAVSTLLLGGFLALMLRTWSAGMGIDCGCFGLGEAISWKTIVRDSALFLFSFALALFAWRAKPLPPAPAPAATETTPPRG
jgi:uncharacterized membrane protein YphA (DoxX/SURF4 family)